MPHGSPHCEQRAKAGIPRRWNVRCHSQMEAWCHNHPFLLRDNLPVPSPGSVLFSLTPAISTRSSWLLGCRPSSQGGVCLPSCSSLDPSSHYFPEGLPPPISETRWLWFHFLLDLLLSVVGVETPSVSLGHRVGEGTLRKGVPEGWLEPGGTLPSGDP